MNDQLVPAVAVRAAMSSNGGVADGAEAHGIYTFECRDADGNLLWREELDNVVTTVGKNAVWDAALAGSGYTVVGPFMGLISSTSFTAVAAGDTMASHTGWLEAGSTNAPTYSGNRGTCAWSAATGGAKALSSALTFTFTGSGTVQGAFIVFGSGAVNTVGSTAGTLFSAGTFSTAQPVINGNTVSVSYSVSM